MNALIIDIRETSLRAVFRDDNGNLTYSRSFEFEPLMDMQGKAGEHQQVSIHDAASENPYLLECHNLWDLELKEALKKVRSEISVSIDSTHLIIPPYEVVTAVHKLPKMAKQDAEKLISRKIAAESKEEIPPFSIVAGASDQKMQTWHSLYIPSSTLKLYQNAFKFGKFKLTSITTPVNAMVNAFQSVHDAIFNAHAVFEIHNGFVEAYYLSGNGILYFERLPFSKPEAKEEPKPEENEQTRKFRQFKIINTIFRINLNYQADHSKIPVEMLWLCGSEKDLEEIASTLKEAMGVETGIAPAIPTGLQNESGYVPLTGFASALLSENATTYSPPGFFRRFKLRRTSGILIYMATFAVALLASSLTERDYAKMKTRVETAQKAAQSKESKAKAAVSASYSNSLETMKNLTSRQFVFYDLFRELANDLPDGVTLESLDFKLKEDKGLLDITAVARISDKNGGNTLLSRFMDMLDRSPTLTDHSEPSISVVTKDKVSFLKISITSEVNPLDSKN